MRRRDFITLLGGAAAAWPLTARGQQTGKVARIGLLGPASAKSHGVEALRAGLRDLGYVEGRDIVIEYRWAEGRYERLAELAAELVRLKVDVILTYGTPGVLAAKQATMTIPDRHGDEWRRRHFGARFQHRAAGRKRDRIDVLQPRTRCETTRDAQGGRTEPHGRGRPGESGKVA